MALLATGGLLAALNPSIQVGRASSDPAPSLATARLATLPERLDPRLIVQWHGMWAHWTDLQRQYQLGQLQAANIHAIRLDVSWAMIQPTSRTAYDPWGVAFVDRVVDMARSYGLAIGITFWLTPGWANGNKGEHVPPTNPADYAAAAQWMAIRYAGRVGALEIWNEPNSPDYFAGASPVTYANLLRPTYLAIKAGNPAMTVVFGGLQYNDNPWLSRAYDAGVKGYFDIMATHGYQSPSNQSPITPDNGEIWKFTHLVAIRNLMVARGDGDKRIFTSTGYSTHSNPAGTPNWDLGVSETTQAIYLYQAVTYMRANWPWAQGFMAYTAMDLPEGALQQHNLGLMRHDMSVKPSLRALTDLSLPDTF